MKYICGLLLFFFSNMASAVYVYCATGGKYCFSIGTGSTHYTLNSFSDECPGGAQRLGTCPATGLGFGSVCHLAKDGAGIYEHKGGGCSSRGYHPPAECKFSKSYNGKCYPAPWDAPVDALPVPPGKVGDANSDDPAVCAPGGGHTKFCVNGYIVKCPATVITPTETCGVGECNVTGEWCRPTPPDGGCPAGERVIGNGCDCQEGFERTIYGSCVAEGNTGGGNTGGGDTGGGDTGGGNTGGGNTGGGNTGGGNSGGGGTGGGDTGDDDTGGGNTGGGSPPGGGVNEFCADQLGNIQRCPDQKLQCLAIGGTWSSATGCKTNMPGDTGGGDTGGGDTGGGDTGGGDTGGGDTGGGDTGGGFSDALLGSIKGSIDGYVTWSKGVYDSIGKGLSDIKDGLFDPAKKNTADVYDAVDQAGGDLSRSSPLDDLGSGIPELISGSKGPNVECKPIPINIEISHGPLAGTSFVSGVDICDKLSDIKAILSWVFSIFTIWHIWRVFITANQRGGI